VLVVGGGSVAGYFLFKPTDQPDILGTLGNTHTTIGRLGHR